MFARIPWVKVWQKDLELFINSLTDQFVQFCFAYSGFWQ